MFYRCDHFFVWKSLTIAILSLVTGVPTSYRNTQELALYWCLDATRRKLGGSASVGYTTTAAKLSDGASERLLIYGALALTCRRDAT